VIACGLALVLGFIIARWGTPVARAAALRFGIVDRPDGVLKRQEEPVPYLGGLAVYLPFLATMAIVYEFDRQVLGLLLAGTLVVLLGLIDDLGVLSPSVKLIGQLIACWVLVKSDVMTHFFFLPYWANVALTVLWILTVTNAMNLMDIMDGLAPGVALVAALALLAVTFGAGIPAIPVMAAALAGSLLGFLPFNLPPARIYLGDSGSMFLGLMLGALTMTARYTAYNRMALLSPLLILGLPLFDTAFVSAVRLARGASPFRGSPDHFPLRLRRLGMPVWGVIGCCYAGAALLGGLALLNTQLPAGRGSLVLVGGVGAGALLFAGFLLWIDLRGRSGAGLRRAEGIRSRRTDVLPLEGVAGQKPGGSAG